MNWRSEQSPPDYLIIGHLTRDQVEQGTRLGGTAAYSAVTASRMGARVAVFTSGAADLPLDILDGIRVFDQAGSGTTTFRNEYTNSGRVQYLTDRAADLNLELLPESWRKSRLVHLAPVAREVPFSSGDLFPDSILAYSLQGWLRSWDQSGRISPGHLPSDLLPQRDHLAGFLSLEDLGFDRMKLPEIVNRFPLLILTLGNQGAELFRGGLVEKVPAVPEQEIDPTGAGDIFAAAYLTAWAWQGRTALQAAKFASRLAGRSVTREGVEGIPSQLEIKELEKVRE